MAKRLELLSPVGSMANLKAAVSKGADAVYLGMNNFTARAFATNFNKDYLNQAVGICKANNVKIYLAMNTLVKNSEINSFFDQLSFAYSTGIDSVIIQEISFIDIIKKNYPDLRVHISTQAGVMNSDSAKLLEKADRITLARELSQGEISRINKNVKKEIEIFCHGALCVSVSGQCLFSSLLGGRSGNRGKCAQPCRKKYNNEFLLSTKELCLIDSLPEIISVGINTVKIEGRMRNPYYVATATEVYRKAIDSYYSGDFQVTKDMKKKLHNAFSREFTTGVFASEDVFNRRSSGGSPFKGQEIYKVKTANPNIIRNNIKPKIDVPLPNKSSEKQLLVRVYSEDDAIIAADSGADVVYMELLDDSFSSVKLKIKSKLFGVTPRIMLDKDIPEIIKAIKHKSPDGILAGNTGLLNYNLNMPLHLEYNSNIFNDLSLDHLTHKHKGVKPIISPELSIKELSQFRNKDFIAMVHGKIRLMTLRHKLTAGEIKDDTGARFIVNRIHNGIEVLNEKEFGLLSKSKQLLSAGINQFFIDSDKDIAKITNLYRDILDNKKIDDKKLKKRYVLGWSYRGVS